MNRDDSSSVRAHLTSLLVGATVDTAGRSLELGAN